MSATEKKTYYACKVCGCTDIEAEFWVELNTMKVTDDAGSDTNWCPQCQRGSSRQPGILARRDAELGSTAVAI